MPMRVEDLIKTIQLGELKTIDTPELTELIETLSYDQVALLHEDDGFVERVMAPIHLLHEQLKSSFVERDELIRIALGSFLVQVPMIALGPPGTAKSLVLRELASRLGLRDRAASIDEVNDEMVALAKGGKLTAAAVPQRRFFEYLVTRYTTADEILGPPDLDLMINHALFYRQTAGLLPEAHVAFLDEVFKANSAILNALLSIMNERIFYNAGRATSIPLCMVFGASNEPPIDQDLSAFYDRFPIRVMCNPVSDEKDALYRALKAANTHLINDVLGGPKGRPQIASVNHFRLMFRLILVREATWRGPEASEFWDAFVNTFRVFRREFQISDRSISRLYRLAQGLALIRNKKYPGRGEIEVIKYCFRDMEAAAALADAVDERVHRR